MLSFSARGMRISFQPNADLDGRILRRLRRAAPEIDIRSAADAALAGLRSPADRSGLRTNSRQPGPSHDAVMIARKLEPRLNLGPSFRTTAWPHRNCRLA